MPRVTHLPTPAPADVPPHHKPGGGFRNPWPSGRRAGAAALARWLVVERVAHPRAKDPDPRVAFPRVASAFHVPRAPDDVVAATWVGHASFLLQIGGWNVLLDPVWGERASPLAFVGPRRFTPPGVDFDALPPVDLVVLSHDHYDHLDAPTVRRLAARAPGARWLAPLGVGARLEALGVPRAAVAERDWWGSVEVGPLAAACVPAQHFSGRGLGDRDRTLWCGWVLRARGPAEDAGRAVYFAGDSGLHPDFAEVTRRCGPVALALLPVGAYAPRWFMRPVHCDPDDALAAYDALCAGQRAAHPGAPDPVFGATHFGAFRLTDEPTDEPPRRTRAAWAAAGRDAARLWVPRHGETRAV
ncbi:hypothetical protein tb265_11870 [Gemmatimonadetes bacterium T265]|nr:hypothetical protein tb265_11870 [Gemmatimonadetes bacterium T265]